MSLRRIESTEELHRYLHVAMQLEHATIPPYLSALYSIHPGTNRDAAEIIHAVLVEEMLHLLLVANLANAVGGLPNFVAPGFVPNYPTHLPDGEVDFEVSIRPFSPEAIATFLQIERPGHTSISGDLIDRERSPRALLPGFVDSSDTEMHFFSIGEFYAEIDRGLHWLHDSVTAQGEHLFSGDPALQVTSEFQYSGGGEIMTVSDLDSAEAAIRLICEQGEGLGGAIYDEEGELSHYYRFEQIKLGRYYQPGDTPEHPSGERLRVDWDAVYPMRIDARLSDYPEGSTLQSDAVAFKDAYADFMQLLTDAHRGHVDQLDRAVGEMFRLKDLAIDLISRPIPGADGCNAGPVFAS